MAISTVLRPFRSCVDCLRTGPAFRLFFFDAICVSRMLMHASQLSCGRTTWKISPPWRRYGSSCQRERSSPPGTRRKRGTTDRPSTLDQKSRGHLPSISAPSKTPSPLPTPSLLGLDHKKPIELGLSVPYPSGVFRRLQFAPAAPVVERPHCPLRRALSCLV